QLARTTGAKRFPYTTLFRSRVPRVGDLAGDALDRRPVYPGIGADQARRADLDDHPATGWDWASHSSSSSSSTETGGVYSKVKSPDRKSTRLNSSHVKISYAV